MIHRIPLFFLKMFQWVSLYENIFGLLIMLKKLVLMKLYHIPHLCRITYSETCIKRTPSIKRTVAEVTKFISLIYFK